MVMMFVEGIVLMFDEIIVLFLLYDIYRGGSFSFPTLMGQAVKQSKQNHIRDTRHRIRRWGRGQETLFLDKTQWAELEGGGCHTTPGGIHRLEPKSSGLLGCEVTVGALTN
jgi:hypothetical protein